MAWFFVCFRLFFFFFKTLFLIFFLNLLWQTEPCSSRKSHQLTGKYWLGFGLAFPWKLCHSAGKTHKMWQGYRYRFVCTFCHKHLLLSGRKKTNHQPKLWVINLSTNLYCAHFLGSSGAVFAQQAALHWELLALSKDKAEMERYSLMGITGKPSSSVTSPKRGLCEHGCRNSLPFV